MHKKSVAPNNLGLDASTDEEPELEDDQNFNDVNEDDGESLTWIILPMSKEEKPLLRCCYQTCDALFDDGQAFRSHFIQQHVMMLQSVGEGKHFSAILYGLGGLLRGYSWLCQLLFIFAEQTAVI